MIFSCFQDRVNELNLHIERSRYSNRFEVVSYDYGGYGYNCNGHNRYGCNNGYKCRDYGYNCNDGYECW